MKIFILITTLLYSLSGWSSEFGSCDLMFPKKRPPEISAMLKSQSKSLCFNDFAILYSTKTKTPVYTVEKMNYMKQFHKEARTNNFHEEAKLSNKDRATLNDYKKSGYDRGHNVPAGDCTNSICMTESFSLANMFPQAPKLNRGAWAKSVEMPTRKYIERSSGDIYIFTGGFYDGSSGTIGSNQVGVPSHVWKLVYDSQKNKSWVYWLKNQDTTKMSAPISYEEFVKKTGLKLLD